jgi:hypothetical protein
MIYVGLLGGASYVNIFYILLNNSKYPEKDRELCINIAALFITVGNWKESKITIETYMKLAFAKYW